MQIHSGVTDRYRTFLLRATGVLAKFLDDTEEDKRFRTAYALLMMAGCFKPIPPRQSTRSDRASRKALEDEPYPMLEPKVG